MLAAPGVDRGQPRERIAEARERLRLLRVQIVELAHDRFRRERIAGPRLRERAFHVAHLQARRARAGQRDLAHVRQQPVGIGQRLQRVAPDLERRVAVRVDVGLRMNRIGKRGEPRGQQANAFREPGRAGKPRAAAREQHREAHVLAAHHQPSAVALDVAPVHRLRRADEVPVLRFGARRDFRREHDELGIVFKVRSARRGRIDGRHPAVGLRRARGSRPAGRFSAGGHRSPRMPRVSRAVPRANPCA
ncbi:impA domain protein [Burkholderia pseudomallei]|nr:impA domain protein [Burkholderia pseudomallei]